MRLLVESLYKYFQNTYRINSIMEQKGLSYEDAISEVRSLYGWIDDCLLGKDIKNANFYLENDSTIDQFRSMNMSNGYTIKRAYGTIPLSAGNDCICKVYSVGSTNEDNPVTIRQLYNINVTSGYRYSMSDYEPMCNTFFRKDFIECSDLTKLDRDQTKFFLKNLRDVCINIIKYRYFMIEEKFHAIASTIIATAVAGRLGIAVTPEFIGEVFGCSIALAEVIIDKYDHDSGDFIGIPWMI